MLSDQRQYELTELICREGKASIHELAERFGVSGETIRRDLNAIAKEGRVRKVHGGAVAVRHPIRDESYAVRQVQNAHHKQKIGQYAARLLEDGDIIGVDAGTCTEAFVREIYNIRELTVITHSMPVATILANKLSAGDFSGSVQLVSGSVDPETYVVSGMATLLQLQGYRMNKVFLAATAISPSGIMSGTENDGLISSTLLHHAEISYVLAESEKLDQQSFFKIAGFDAIIALITDDAHPASHELAARIAEGGAELITVTTKEDKL